MARNNGHGDPIGRFTMVCVLACLSAGTAGVARMSGTPSAGVERPAPPDLDATFGVNGVVRVDLAGRLGEAAGVVRLPDPDGGAIVAGRSHSTAVGDSELVLARLASDGTLRTDWGTGGLVTETFGGSVSGVAGLVGQADGSLIVAGTVAKVGRVWLFVARFLADGTLDPSFGGGSRTDEFGLEYTDARSVAVQTDGKVLVGGMVDNVDRPGDAVWFLARYLAAGGLDPGFGSGGVVKRNFSNGNLESVNAILTQADGRIVAAGGAGNDRLHLARYQSNGALDTTFATGGILTDFGLGPASAVVQMLDGSYVVGGNKVVGGSMGSPAVVLGYLHRFDASGAPDYAFRITNNPSLGIAGEKTLDEVRALYRYPNGKLAVAGVHRGEYALAAHNPDGSLDAGFGEAGFELTGLAGDARALTVDGYASVLAVGSSDNDIVVTRHDGAPAGFAVGFVERETSAVEGTGVATLAVRLGMPSSATVTVEYSTSDGTATAPADYLATSGTLAFAPGETLKTFDVPLVSDNDAEGEETILVTLANASGAVIGTPNPATVVVMDSPAVSMGPGFAVLEASGRAMVPVTLLAASPVPVTVFYEVSGGTAVAGADYLPPVGSVVIPAGARLAAFEFPLVIDQVPEPEETVEIRLTGATNATLSGVYYLTTTLTIVDDPETCSACPVVSIPEGSSVHVPVSGIAEIRASTADLTATAGLDYQPLDNVLVGTGVMLATMRDQRYEGAGETFVVNLLSDGPVFPSPIILVHIQDGGIVVDEHCTLAAAIQSANDDKAPVHSGCTDGDGDDAVYLPPGTYTFTNAPYVYGSLATPVPAITSDVRLQGAGPDLTVLQRSSAPGTPPFRLFFVAGPGAHFTLSDLTVRNASASGSGGAIFNLDTEMVIERCRFEHNVATSSGGVYSDFNGGMLAVVDSTFVNNVAGGHGGALTLYAGKLTVVGSRFTGNTSGGSGGAINGGSAQLFLQDTSFINNTAGADAGAVNGGGGGSHTIRRSSFRDNHASQTGAVQIGGTSLVEDSLFTGNEAWTIGGLRFVGPGTLTLERSTFAANTASGDRAGGLSLEAAATLVNVTVSGNSSRGGGGGIFLGGGATFTLRSLTVADNTTGWVGGGLLVESGTVRMSNSILAGNRNAAGSLQDLYRTGGTFTSDGFNLVAAGVGTNVTFGSDDLTGTAAGALDAGLGPLLGLGGQTPTRLLLASSLALDAGSPLAVGSAPACPTTDQRGVSRGDSAAGRCDIGAYERVQTTGVDLALGKTSDAGLGFAGEPVTYRLTAINQGDATATGVVVTDVLPPGLSPSSATASHGACAISGSTVSCTLGALGPGDVATIDLVATATAAGVWSNRAMLTADTGTGVPADGIEASADVAVKAPIIVTTTAEGNGGGGDCTLSEAILAANTDRPVDGCAAGSAGDLIVVPAGTYTLTAPVSGTPFGLPVLGSWITIRGAGMADTVIERSSAAGTLDFGIFRLQGNGLTLSDLTVRNGSFPSGSGGGLSTLDGSVTLVRTAFERNRANNGGAYSDFNGGNLTVVDSTFTANRAAGSGGAVSLYAGTASFTGAVFSGNTADYGGAITNRAALLSIDATTFAGNQARSVGGAVNTGGATRVTGCSFRDNVSVTGSGGGLEASGWLRIYDTVFLRNRAGTGGGLRFGGSSSAEIGRSTFAGNAAVGERGGAIEAYGVIALINSTLSGNDAKWSGGGVFLWSNGRLTLRNATLYGNTVAGGSGGGIYLESGTLTLSNSLLAGNTHGAGSAQEIVRAGSSTITSQGYNLFGSNAGIASALAPSDLSGTATAPLDPRLGPLAGGPTPAHALAAGSPAVDAGNPASPGSAADACSASDQQGRSRTGPGAGARCDIGAIERAPSAGASLSMAKTGERGRGWVGQPFAWTIDVANDGDTASSDVTMTDALPVGVAYLSAASNQGSCSEAAGTVTCALGPIAAGATATVVVLGVPASPGVVTNVATLSGAGGEIAASAAVAVTAVVDPIVVNTSAQSPGATGDCTIGEAIKAANTDRAVDGCAAGAGTDLIVVPANLYLFDHQEASNPGFALPWITTDIIVQGAGAGSTILERPLGVADQFGFFGGGTLTLNDVTIRGGNRPGGGGAIYTADTFLAVNRVVFDNNGGWYGGAISDFNGGYARVTDSVFLRNHAGSGGAIAHVGPLQVVRSTFDQNTAIYGGAVSSGSMLTMTESLFTGNGSQYEGGALRADGPAWIARSTFRGNAGGLVNNGNGSAGAVAANGSLLLVESTFEANTAPNAGALAIGDGPLTILGTTFVGNVAWGSAAGALRSSASGRIENSTFSGNRAADRAGALQLHGGSMLLRHVTVTANVGTNRGPGGLIVTNAAAVTIEGSILAGNAAPSVPDVYREGGAVTSSGSNLIGSVTWSNASFTGPGDLIGTASAPLDPRVGPLADNGGPTRTHEPLAGSPAIDAAAASGCPAVDQRGVSRPQGPACDIGAVERSLDSSEADLSVTLTATPEPVEVGHELAYTILAHNAGPADATATNVLVTLPAGATLVSAAATQGTQSKPADRILFHLGALAASRTAAMTVRVVPTVLGTTSAIVALGAAEPDPDVSNNTAEVTSTVRASTELRVDLVSPNRAGQGGRVIVALTGVGFEAGATVTLKRAGESDLVAGDAAAADNGLVIAAYFDIGGRALGMWDLEVANPDGRTAMVVGAFQIEPARVPQIVVDVLGPDVLRPGQTAVYQIVVGNRGNADAYGIPLYIDTSAWLGGTLLPRFDFAPAPILPGATEYDYDAVSPRLLSGDGSLIRSAIYIPVVRAGTLHTLSLSVSIPATTTENEFQIGGTSLVSLVEPLSGGLNVQQVGLGLEAATALALAGEIDAGGPRVLAIPLESADGSSTLASAVGEATGDPAVAWSSGGSSPGGYSFNPCSQLGPRPGTSACIQSIFIELLNLMAAIPAGANQAVAGCVRSAISASLGSLGSLCSTNATGGAGDPYFTANNLQGILAGVLGVAVSCLEGAASSTLGLAMNVYALTTGAFDIAANCFDVPVDASIMKRVQIFRSADPNEKAGAVGTGDDRFITGLDPLRYAILFENKPDATAPAQKVVITDQLDLASLDLDTFSFGPVRFGDTDVTLPAGTAVTKDVDLRPANDLIVRITAGLDLVTGVATWRFQSLDSATGEPTEDALAGFLPANVNGPEGDGSVAFFVQPKAGLPTGTTIPNQARIIFDLNPPIDTNTWVNTIDNTPPVSHVVPLPPEQNGSRFTVSWTGADVGAGVRDFAVFVSTDGGPFTQWLSNATDTAVAFDGQPGHTYAFFSVARDQAYNRESKSEAAEATTTVLPIFLGFDEPAYTVSEGAGVATITVTRSGNTGDAVSVNYTTSDGTATAGADYAATSAMLDFAPGETAKTFTIPVIDDVEAEADEQVQLVLSFATSGAVLTTQTAVLTILDNEPPNLAVPDDLTAEATGPSGAAVTFSATATSHIDAVIAAECDPPSGSTFPMGDTTVTCTTTDSRGGTASGSFTVTVVDTTPPTLASPGDQTFEATDGAGAVVAYTAATATDAVSPPTVGCTPASDTPFGLGTTPVTCTATDAAGNQATVTFLVAVVDTTPPATVATPSGSTGANDWFVGDATLLLHATDSVGVSAIRYTLAGAQAAGPVDAPGGDASVVITAEGQTTVTFQALDTAGNAESEHTVLVAIDRTPPAASCDGPDGVWHADNVALGCSAADATSGLAVPADALFALVTAVAAGQETADAATQNHQVCDLAGLCATAGPIGGNRVDRRAPAVTVVSPSDTTYSLNAVVLADYTCADGGSGVASCDGPVASGQPFDTSTPGSHTFAVTTVDAVGNRATVTRTYAVSELTGRMKGEGHLQDGPDRHFFEFQVEERRIGRERGSLRYWTEGRRTREDGDHSTAGDKKESEREKGKEQKDKDKGQDKRKGGDDRRRGGPGRFESTAMTSIAFWNDPAFQPGRKPRSEADSVVFTGAGTWNGRPGYTFEASATDMGEPGRGHDTFALTIRDPQGAVVAEVLGTLAGGNIQALGVEHR